MKIIGLVPVRNEAWVLEHSLAALSGFCDVILVSDQASDDGSRDICGHFPKVVLIKSREPCICEVARWRLLDAAREYDGCNLWWWSDADELVSPRLASAVLCRDLPPGSAVECWFYHLWESPMSYRDDLSLYRPQRKLMAIVDDRRRDYDRSSNLPLHQPRVTVGGDSRPVCTSLPVLHLQWLLPRRNQMKQAWYRCRELLNGDRSVEAINRKYAITLLPTRVKASPVAPEWIVGLTFPDFRAAELEPSWQERDILNWFATRGAGFFEPLEIWHIASLRSEFVRQVGRRPRPDRSHHPSRAARARQLAVRALNAGRRRLAT